MDARTNTAETAKVQPAESRWKRRHVPTKRQLLTRDQLDGRTNAAKVFSRIISSIEADLGGHDQLSVIEQTLVEAYVGAYITLSRHAARDG